jgi:hypothetical protein
MKSLRLLIVGLLLSTTSVFSVSAQAAEPSVTVSGITLSWPAVIYRPVSSSQVTMSIANNSGRTLLYVAYTVTDRIGTQVAFGSATEIPRGLSSITHVWYAKDIDVGKAPFTLAFYVAYFPSAGIPNPPSVSAEFDFASRSAGGASPTAAPTVAKTATPSSAPTVYITNPSDKNLNDLVTSLKSQVNLLNAKLKKICAVKPKPKNC